MAEETEEKTEVPAEPGDKPEEKNEPETKTLTQEEINKLIEAARKQEKDKLYTTMEGLREQVTSLSEERKKEKDEKEKAEEQARLKAEEERKAKLSAEDRLAEQLKAFESRLAKEAEERVQLTTQLEQEKKERQLEIIKAKLLKEAGDEIISDLVQGTSQEELETSVASAKQKYQDYFAAAVNRSKGPGGRLPTPRDPDPEPLDEEAMKGLIPDITPDTTVKAKKNRKEILANSNPVSEDYVKNREEILARVGNLYKQQNR